MEGDAPVQDVAPAEEAAAPVSEAPTPMWGLDFQTTSEPPVLVSLNNELGDGSFGAVECYRWHHSHIGKPQAL